MCWKLIVLRMGNRKRTSCSAKQSTLNSSIQHWRRHFLCVSENSRHACGFYYCFVCFSFLGFAFACCINFWYLGAVDVVVQMPIFRDELQKFFCLHYAKRYANEFLRQSLLWPLLFAQWHHVTAFHRWFDISGHFVGVLPLLLLLLVRLDWLTLKLFHFQCARHTHTTGLKCFLQFRTQQLHRFKSCCCWTFWYASIRTRAKAITARARFAY